MSKSIKGLIVISSALALILLQSTALWGGTTGKIAGRVIDAGTGELLAGTNVIIVGTMLGGAADAEGDYFIINVPPGTYEVQATMIGYQALTLTDIIVRIDHTTPVDFGLTSTVITGEAVTVTGEVEVVKMDESASVVHTSIEAIEDVPLVTNVQQFINLQTGVEGEVVRGGGRDETQFMLDGLMVVDNRTNAPIMSVNLSSIKEISIIKGGFNAEYGNLRSGLINIVTKDPSPTEYSGTINLNYTLAHLKHSGVSLFEHDNFYLRPYLDPGVMWVGTENGDWSEEKQHDNLVFIGWDAYSAALLSDADPENDRTPTEARDYYIWQHRAEGSGALGRPEGDGSYGDEPDVNIDVTLGGPVPIIGRFLGDLTFMASVRQNKEQFPIGSGIPENREFFVEQNSMIKFTSRLSRSMKLKVEASYGALETMPTGDFSYLSSAEQMLRTGRYASAGEIGENRIYHPAEFGPEWVWRGMVGVAFDHVLSPKTFYSVRFSNTRIKNFANGAYQERDMTVVRYFGNTPVTEEPWGIDFSEGKKTMDDGMVYCYGSSQKRDWSLTNTQNFKFDLTSQINKYNQIKFGLLYNRDDIDNRGLNVRLDHLGSIRYYDWHHIPFRGGAYLQDKIEFKGMIANIGVRVDFTDPNADWYTAERYSAYFSKKYINTYDELLPKEPAETHVKISPRLGISHPISERAKLYFNYGHFYSMAGSRGMYQIRTNLQQGIYQLGNPSADMPKTVAYELGLDYNLGNLLIHLSGYYKDASDQTGDIRYTSFDGSVNYETTENNNYADIRGFEIEINKAFGRWITGWINYDYMVTTEGFIGREQYYEDERMNLVYGFMNPYQERPIARPVMRANVIFSSPDDFGPGVAGIKPLADLSLALLYSWRAGRYETWDPLETRELQQNVQWRPEWYFDARVSKGVNLGRYTFDFFLDINNVLNIEHLSGYSFFDSRDEEDYFESLHLEMYDDPIYEAEGYTGGDDKPGDVRSDDKPYIDMPMRDFMYYLNQRSITCGLRLNF